MMGLPVIVRELRAESHRPVNYWLRVMGAGAVILFMGAMLLNRSRAAPESGAAIFEVLHTTLFVGIWIFVPLLTADCLSHEKREGTLGLLFLTRLTPQSIVGAKAVIHVARALTLMLAMAPALLLPFILGGIDWHESVIALNLNLAAMFAALAAGLCASAWCRTLLRTVTLAVILSVVAASLFSYVYAWGFFRQVTDRIYYASTPAGISAIGLLLSTGTGPVWSEVLGKLSVPERNAWVWLSAEMLASGLAALVIAIVVSGLRLRRNWQHVPSTVRQIRFMDAFCVPRFGVDFMRRHLRVSLERNPVGWLQEYSWSARALKWGWLGLFGVTDAWLITEQMEGGRRWRDLLDAQFYLSIALCLGMAASAVGSFRRERENGVLELLLVTQLSAEKIILGRILGIWSQFFPAALLLVVVWFYVLGIGPVFHWAPNFKWFFMMTFVTLPVVGLWCSLAHRSFLVAFLMSAGCGIAVPYMVGMRLAGLVLDAEFLFLGVAGGLQLAAAALAWRFLLRNLARRTFAMN